MHPRPRSAGPRGGPLPSAWRRQLAPVLGRSAGFGIATAAGLGFFLLASPILTRLYDPAAFGRFGVYTAGASFLGLLATLRYEMAVAIPHEDREAWDLVRLCLRVGGLALALAGLLLACTSLLVPGAELTLPLHLALAIPVGAGLAAAQAVLAAWAVRRDEFRALGQAKVLYGLVGAALQVSFGFSLGPVGLIVGDLAGRLVGLVPLALLGLRTAPRTTSGVGAGKTPLRHFARRFGTFARLSTPSAAINGLGLLAPTVLVALLFGPAAAGMFALGQRIIGTPILLIGEAATQIFTGKAGARRRAAGGGSMEQVFLRASGILAAIGFPMLAAIAWIGPAAFGLVFGAEWTSAGHLARALAIGAVGQFVAAPTSPTLAILERQGLQLAWDIGRLVAVAGSLMTASWMGATVGQAVAVMSLTIFITYAVLWRLGWGAAIRYDRARPSG